MRRAITAVVACAVLVVATPAAAQTDRDVAVKLGEQALEAYHAGRWSEAYDKFEAADKLVSAPPFIVFMARSKRNQDELVAAARLFRRALVQPVDPDAPAAFRRATDEAKEELASLVERIPTLLVMVADATAETRVMIDDVAYEVTDKAIELDPGKHRVVVVTPGMASDMQQIDLAEGGGETQLLVTLRETRAADPTPKPVPEGDVATEGLLWPAMIALGVGAAGVGVGAVTAVMAASRVSDLEESCGGTVCPSDRMADVDEAGVLADVATVGFIIGGVGLATGIALVIWQPSADKNDLAIVVSPRGVTVKGRF